MARRAATTLALATLATAFAPMPATARSAPMRAAFYDLADVANDGSEVAFSQFEGKVCYAVNVASAWGATRPGYKLMKQLSDEFGDDLAVIAFPTGEFGGQELPTDEAIAKFAYDRVKFPAAPRGVLLQKADLGRASWQAMQAEAGADAPAWNFKGKFLVSRDGAVTDASGVDDIAAAVKALL